MDGVADEEEEEEKGLVGVDERAMLIMMGMNVRVVLSAGGVDMHVSGCVCA